MTYARTQAGAIRRVKIKRELRRLGHTTFRNDDPLKELKSELKNLKKARVKSNDRQFVMDSFAYESEMNSCPRSMSFEHAYEPYGKSKIKCVHCGYKKSVRYPK
jgi:hypothetical protein